MVVVKIYLWEKLFIKYGRGYADVLLGIRIVRGVSPVVRADAYIGVWVRIRIRWEYGCGYGR